VEQKFGKILEAIPQALNAAIFAGFVRTRGRNSASSFHEFFQTQSGPASCNGTINPHAGPDSETVQETEPGRLERSPAPESSDRSEATNRLPRTCYPSMLPVDPHAARSAIPLVCWIFSTHNILKKVLASLYVI